MNRKRWIVALALTSIAAAAIGIFVPSYVILDVLRGIFESPVLQGLAAATLALAAVAQWMATYLAKPATRIDMPSNTPRTEIRAANIDLDIIDDILHSSSKTARELDDERESRLMSEIDSQGQRANLNLILGVISALFGLVFLSWLSIDQHRLLSIPEKQNLNPMIYWGSFSSKIALSSASAIFAFIFLTTYRRNLSEIRYFHNELTNIEAQRYAVENCVGSKSDATKFSILKIIAATERNFVIRKTDTTIDLAQKSLDGIEMAAFFAAAEEFAKSTRPHRGSSSGGRARTSPRKKAA